MDLAKSNPVQNPEAMALIDVLKNALSTNDPAGSATRAHLKESAEKLSLALETPGETVQRIANYVRSFSYSKLAQFASCQFSPHLNR